MGGGRAGHRLHRHRLRRPLLSSRCFETGKRRASVGRGEAPLLHWARPDVVSGPREESVIAFEPAPGARQAVARAALQFNRGEFWECHETLEEFWGDEHGPLRQFYHGFIQVAAGFVHVQRHNWHGAVRLLGAGFDRLLPFRPSCMGVALEPLLSGVAEWRRLLASRGADGDWTVQSLPLPIVLMSDPG